VDVTDLDTIDSTIEVLEPGKIARPSNPFSSPIPLSEMQIEVAMVRPKTIDPDPLIECQIFNLREDFLSLCQGNKYQFDELRRAKHSSMMILYHLHNPESDAFVHTCNGCKMDITTARYTCMTCQDFDLCQNCNGKVRHAHPLEKVTSSTSSVGGDLDGEGGTGSATGDAAAQQAKNNHTAYLQMLEHCSACDNPNCPVPNCIRMKKLLEHAPSCQVRISGGCANCKRYWQFLAFHARQCRRPAGTCKVPHCERIKGHIRAQANKVADRRMMALMNRTNQMAAPPSTDEPSNSYATENGQANTTPAPAGQVAGGPPPVGRPLTSPRGKGGKGPRMAN
jgi:E1A/CREB-binding protein